MRKLKIVFTDNSQVIYTIKNSVSWEPYFHRHSRSGMKSAILQQYPKKNYEPVDLLNEVWYGSSTDNRTNRDY